MEVVEANPQAPTSGRPSQSSNDAINGNNTGLLPHQESGRQTLPNQKQAPKQQGVPAGKKNHAKGPSLVQGLAEWEFPKDVVDKLTFVNTSLRQGKDATPRDLPPPRKEKTVAPAPVRTQRPSRGKRKRYDEKTLESNVIASFQDKRESILFSSPQRMGRRTRDAGDDFFEKTIVPKAFDIEFDKRFVNYAVAPDGSEMREKFVWSLGKGQQTPSLGLRDARMEMVPNLPKRSKKGMSRVGPMYQARIPKFGELGDLYETPGYDKVWDPEKAAEAERQGQDISGYLAASNNLDRSELLMKILHENDYKVESAIEDIKKVQLFRTPFKLIQHRELEDDWCSFLEVNVRDPKTGKAVKKCKFENVENDITMVCDGCGRNYHQECLGYKSVPPGKWFCPVCSDHLAELSISVSGGAPK